MRLTDVKTVRAALGGTVNDVVLTVITNGFRDLLGVARRGAGARRRGPHDGPRLGPPQGREGRLQQPRLGRLRGAARRPRRPARARLERIRGEMDGIKETKQAVAGDVLSSMSGFAPPLLLALGSRLVTASPRLNMHTATTNVPGPAAARPDARPADARVLPLRPRRRLDPDRRRDLLLRRRPLLRRHRRLRRRPRHRCPDRRHRPRHEGPAGARRAAADAGRRERTAGRRKKAKKPRPVAKRGAARLRPSPAG